MKTGHGFRTTWAALVAALLIIVGVGGAARALVANPYYVNPVLDPALQPKFVNAVPNPLVPGFILTPDTATYGPTVDYYTVSARQIVQQSGLVSETTGLPLSTTYWGYGDSRATATTGLHTFPGPTFEIRSNRPSRVLWANELPNVQLLPIDTTIGCGVANCPPVSIVTHVHGAHVQGDSDGGPLSWFSPGFAQTSPWWDPNTAYGLPGTYSYPNTQEAATIWYHDHAQRFTHTNVYAGLAGFYLIRDANEDALQLANKLPKFPYEVPLAIQDRDFYPTGALALPDQPVRDLKSLLCTIDPLTLLPIPATCPVVNDPATGLPIPSMTPEFFGGIIQVNGIVWPKLDVEPRPYRLRLLNGSDSRTYILQFANNLLVPQPNIKFYQIGTDQGFLNAPVMQTQIVIQPGERMDVLVDFTGVANGTQLILQNVGPEGPYNGLVPGSVGAPPVATATTTGQIMAFNVNLALGATPSGNATPSVSPATITTLRPAPIPTLVATAGVAPRKIFLQEVPDIYGRLTLTINGVPMMNPVTEIPTLGNTEIWEIANNTPDTHPIHLHLVQFQVLDRTTFNTLTFVPPAAGAPPAWTLTGLPVAPPAQEAGWKDTIQMMPGTVTRVIAKFDLAGSYVYHCHILSHEENDMMRPYIVTTAATAMAPLTLSVPGPQAAGAALPVKIAAEASTNLIPERSADAFAYQFLIQPPGGALTPVQPFTTPFAPLKSYTWTPPSIPGVYNIRVEARGFASLLPFEVFATATYTLTGNVTGVVTNPATGLPVAGASVTVTGGPTATTDAGGNYAFNLAAGTYTVTFTGAGLGTSTGTLTVAATGVATLNSALTAATSSILTGTITSAGLPAAGVTVTATPAVGAPVSGVTNAAGVYTLVVPAGTYTITTTALGFAGTTAAATAVAGTSVATPATALVAAANGTLTGTITDAVTGLPVAGVVVTTVPGGFTGTTGATGTYSIAVPPGTYTTSVSMLGYAPGAGAPTVIPAAGTAASNVAVNAAANGALTGTITDAATGLPVAGATVTANPGGYAGVTNASGVYTIAVPPGSYTVTTTAMNFANGATAAATAVAAGQTVAAVNVPLAAAAPGTLTGVITDPATGLPVAGATVTANPGGYTGVTSATGNYTILAPAGTYTLTTTALGFANSTGTATVPVGGAGVVNIPMATATNGMITGTVTSGGLPAAGVTVTVNPGGLTGVTNASGVYSVPVGPGSYTATVGALGFVVTTTAVPTSVAAGQIATAPTVALTAGVNGTLTGMVVDPLTGMGMGGVTVTANPGGFTGTTDSMGNYSIPVPPGTFTVTASMGGFYNATTSAVVAAGDEGTADLTLAVRAATGLIDISVHNALTDTDVPDVAITLNPGSTFVSDAEGDLAMQLEPGNYSVTVSKVGYQQTTLQAEIVPGETTTLSVDLAPNASVRTSSDNSDGGFCFVESLELQSTGFGNWRALVALTGMLLAFAVAGLIRQRN